MGSLRFSHNGWVVHLPNPIQDPLYDQRVPNDVDKVEFKNRRPVVANDRSRRVYVGEPGWYHHDVVEHHQLGNSVYDDVANHQGYFNGGNQWGGGKLKWFNGGPEEDDHRDIAESLRESGFDIPDDPDRLENGLAEVPSVDWDAIHHPWA
jgi:hypothetical protein